MNSDYKPNFAYFWFAEGCDEITKDKVPANDSEKWKALGSMNVKEGERFDFLKSGQVICLAGKEFECCFALPFEGPCVNGWFKVQVYDINNELIFSRDEWIRFQHEPESGNSPIGNKFSMTIEQMQDCLSTAVCCLDRIANYNRIDLLKFGTPKHFAECSLEILVGKGFPAEIINQARKIEN